MITIFLDKREARQLRKHSAAAWIIPASLIFSPNDKCELQCNIRLGEPVQAVTHLGKRLHVFAAYASVMPLRQVCQSDIKASGHRLKKHFYRALGSKYFVAHQRPNNPVVVVIHLMRLGSFRPAVKRWSIPINEFPGYHPHAASEWLPPFLDETDLDDLHGIISEAVCMEACSP